MSGYDTSRRNRLWPNHRTRRAPFLYSPIIQGVYYIGPYCIAVGPYWLAVVEALRGESVEGIPI